MPLWVRIKGDGQACAGPCFLWAILFYPDGTGKYTDVYDGRDSGSGKLFARLRSAGKESVSVHLPVGVPFDAGIYIDAESSDQATTVVFEPLIA